MEAVPVHTEIVIGEIPFYLRPEIALSTPAATLRNQARETQGIGKLILLGTGDFLDKLEEHDIPPAQPESIKIVLDKDPQLISEKGPTDEELRDFNTYFRGPIIGGKRIRGFSFVLAQALRICAKTNPSDPVIIEAAKLHKTILDTTTAIANFHHQKGKEKPTDQGKPPHTIVDSQLAVIIRKGKIQPPQRVEETVQMFDPISGKTTTRVVEGPYKLK